MKICLFALMIAAGIATQFPAAAADSGAVSVWVSSADGRNKLTKAADLQVSPAQNAADIVIHPETRYQSFAGVGAALTDASAWLIRHRMDEKQRWDLLRELFSPDDLHLSLVRVTIGASDFSLTHYSLDDVPAGQRDPDLKHFTIAQNRDAVLPVARQIRKINPEVKFIATPWSAPAWMKSGDNLIGGALRPDAYAAFSRYLGKFVSAYEREGVPVFAITMQNEPNFLPEDYPGMKVTAPERARFIAEYLGPLFAANHPHTQILDWDHNWDEPASPMAVLGDAQAARYVSGIAWHCYRGEVSAQGSVHDAHPSKDVWLTECSGGEWAPHWGDTLGWMARNLIIGSVQNWSKGVLMWNLALDENHGPHTGGCADCRGVVTVDSKSGGITRNVEYYALGHVSRFVKSGAYRIDSRSEDRGIAQVAFRNPDGSFVLIAYNASPSPKRFSVRVENRAFSETLDGGSLATFVWH